MKKLFSLVAIAAVALTSFTSCNKNNEEPTPAPTKAKLTLSVDKPTILKDAEGTFTVTSDIAAPADIVIAVKSTDDKVLTVSPASVTIAKDKKTITGKYKGIADGKAKIEITASGVTISVASFEVVVGEAPVGGAKIVAGSLDGFECNSNSEPNNWAAITAGDFSASTFYFNTDWTGAAGKAERISIDNYGGKVVGKKESFGIVLTFVEKDTPIDDKLAWVENTDHEAGYGGNRGDDWMCEPYIWVDGEYTDLEGKEGYIVVNFMGESSEAPGWIYVKVAKGSVTFGDFACATTPGEFKVGQTK